MLVLLDALSLVHRAYHGMPKLVRGARCVGATRGFASKLLQLIREYQPTHVAVVCDGPLGSLKKRALYPGYKAAREKNPEIEEQVFDCQRVTLAFGVSWLSCDEEADDLIASLVHQLLVPTIVVSGDKDLRQLLDVHGRVRIRDLAHDEQEMDWTKATAAYGFPPTYLPDYYALIGDSSDGLPGVPGVGPKKAAALINQFGSLEAIYANATPETCGAAYKRLHAPVELPDESALPGPLFARLMQRLVKLNTTLPVPPLAELARRCASREEIRRVFGELGFVLPSTDDMHMLSQLELVR